MHRNARNICAAVVGTATALCLASSLIVAACGFRVTAPDFPVLKLSSSAKAVEPAASPAE